MRVGWGGGEFRGSDALELEKNGYYVSKTQRIHANPSHIHQVPRGPISELKRVPLAGAGINKRWNGPRQLQLLLTGD